MQYIKLYLIKLLYLTCAFDIVSNTRNYIPLQWYNRDLFITKTSNFIRGVLIVVKTQHFSVIMDSKHVEVIIYSYSNRSGCSFPAKVADVNYDFEKDYSNRKSVSWYRFYLQKQVSKIGRELWEKLCADKGVEYGPTMYSAQWIFEGR